MNSILFASTKKAKKLKKAISLHLKYTFSTIMHTSQGTNIEKVPINWVYCELIFTNVELTNMKISAKTTHTVCAHK